MDNSILVDKIEISPEFFLYRFKNSSIASSARPGQFVEVKIPEYRGFRKPISIYDVNDETFDLLIKTVGLGTELLTKVNVGTELSISRPLGNGFSYPNDEDVLLVAGGIGWAPLHFLASELRKQGKTVNIIFSPKRNKEVIELSEKESDNVIFAENRKETKELLDNLLAQKKGPVKVYTCGPDPFMEMIHRTASAAGAETEVSVESRMSCGMGVCLGCVISCRNEDGTTEYRTVCHDGPVFPGKEVFYE